MGSCYAKKAVDIALSQIGYEGDGKYCKYSEELDSVKYFNYPKNGAADWCSIFVNWCVYKATIWPDEDVYTAHYMMCEPDVDNAAAGCTQASGYFKAHDAWYTNPKDFERGDQIFFWKSNKAIYHTGIITGWNENGLEVVEGNTNGGMVAKKFYSYNDEKIAGVGRPRYDGWQIEEKPEEKPVTTNWDKVFTDIARDCYLGKYGNGLDRKHAVNNLGYGNIFSEVQKRVNMFVTGELKF